jgi:hypothetical protein
LISGFLERSASKIVIDYGLLGCDNARLGIAGLMLGGNDQLIADVTVVDDFVPRSDQHLSKVAQVLALAPQNSLRGDDRPAMAIKQCKQVPVRRG